MSTIVLTPDEAYLAMFSFLQNYWERDHSEAIGALLGSLSLLPDGKPADTAVTSDWNDAVQAARSAGVDANMRISK